MKTMQREFERWGIADVDAVFDGRLKVRCPRCGSRFALTVSRRPIEVGGLHRARGVCSCDKVEVYGTVALTFKLIADQDGEVA